MLKFTEYLFEADTTEDVVRRVPGGPNQQTTIPTPSTTTSLKKPKFQTFAECGEYVKKVVAGRKKRSENNDNPNPEYNGVYITTGSNFIINGQSGYKYELAYANNYQNQMPFFHVTGIGTPVDPNIQNNTGKGDFKIVPDKYFPNVERFFHIINSWKSLLSNTTPVNASTINNYEDFLFEVTTLTDTKQPTNNNISNNPSPSTVNPPQKKPMSVNNFLNMNISNMRSEKFANFKDYKEVLATLEMLLGDKEKNIQPIITDMYVKDFLNISGQFKKASEAEKLKPLWYLKIKTVDANGEPIFTKIKFNTLIKNGSEIKICKTPAKEGEPSVKIDVKIQSLTEKDI